MHVDLDGFPFMWQLWIFLEGTGRNKGNTQWDIIGNRARPWLDRTAFKSPCWWNGQLCESKTRLKESPTHIDGQEVIRLHREKLRKEDEQPKLLPSICYSQNVVYFFSSSSSLVFSRPRWPKKDNDSNWIEKKNQFLSGSDLFFFPRENVGI